MRGDGSSSSKVYHVSLWSLQFSFSKIHARLSRKGKVVDDKRCNIETLYQPDFLMDDLFLYCLSCYFGQIVLCVGCHEYGM